MNILVVFTGGTIGSKITDGYIAPEVEGHYTLIDRYQLLAERDNTEPVDFEIIQPYNILSENLSAFHINQLITCLKDCLSEESRADGEHFDGIIVTHGTDTIQYTSAALGYAFANSNIPIVLVSSNYIPDDERANGPINFYSAVEFIRYCTNNNNIKGVFVSYLNDGEVPLIHRATRLLPHTAYSDKLYSIADKTYGCFKDNTFIPNNDGADVSSTDSVQYSEIELDSQSAVLYMRPVPGQSYPSIEEHVKAILFDTYHSGTLCTDDNNFTYFINTAIKRNIPVFLTGVENRIGYVSTRIYKDMNIHILPKASPIAMYMKLWFLTSAYNGSALEEEMEKNIGYEFIS